MPEPSPKPAPAPVRVRCELRRSAFSGERIFVLPNYAAGCAAARYCLRPDGSPAGDWPAHGESLAGLVTGFASNGLNPGGETPVQLPDGEIYLLTDDQIVTVADELAHLRAELLAIADALASALATPDRAERQKLLEMAEARARDAGGRRGQ